MKMVVYFGIYCLKQFIVPTRFPEKEFDDLQKNFRTLALFDDSLMTFMKNLTPSKIDFTIIKNILRHFNGTHNLCWWSTYGNPPYSEILLFSLFKSLLRKEIDGKRNTTYTNFTTMFRIAKICVKKYKKHFLTTLPWIFIKKHSS